LSTVAVFSRPGRDELTERTIGLLDGHGGASTVGATKILWWCGETPPPLLPRGWEAIWRARPVGRPVSDFVDLARHVPIGDDLHMLEDDVIPCRNLIPYVVRRPVEYFTSYFNPWRRPAGAPLLVDGYGFDCSQAISIPQRLVERFGKLQPQQLVEERRGQDVLIHVCLQLWREPCVWGPSLVQHRKGPRATGRQRPEWLRDPAFVGDDVDALTLPDEAFAPLPAARPAPILRPRAQTDRWRR
jgi:hypothetical protein